MQLPIYCRYPSWCGGTTDLNREQFADGELIYRRAGDRRQDFPEEEVLAWHRPVAQKASFMVAIIKALFPSDNLLGFEVGYLFDDDFCDRFFTKETARDSFKGIANGDDQTRQVITTLALTTAELSLLG
ncbi:MAG: hypothetical protein HC890_15025 [Chloroflexaceae bacterium]|nr:hypothetical protein [Chloroflexaceae bacterium]